MLSRPIKVYVSRSLKYPKEAFKEVVQHLTNEGFLVTYHDEKGKYSSQPILDADVFLCLTPSKIDSRYTEGNNVVGESFIGKGQYNELKIALCNGKLITINNRIKYLTYPDTTICVNQSFITDIKIYLFSSMGLYDITSWKKQYAKVQSTSYGEDGASFYNFVTGNLQVENKVNHVDNIQITSDLRILLLSK